MARQLWIWEMTPDSSPEGTVMVTDGTISPGEVEDCLEGAMDSSSDLVIVYLVLSHPPIRLDAGFVAQVSHAATVISY